MNAEVIPFPTSAVADYIAHGWKLCLIAKGTKGPRAKNWNIEANALKAPPPPGSGVGLMHAFSKTACLDFDDLARATTWLAEKGIDADALLDAPDAVKIVSGRPNRAKLLYACPEPLRSFKLADGALELRCATSTGKSCQDVLPPTLHMKTGKPYEWEFNDLADGSWKTLPPLPDAVRTLWESLITRPEQPAEHTAPQLDPEDEETAERLRALLAQHDPDAGYDAWCRVGMALHHASAGSSVGFDEWDAWSAKGSKYPGTEKLAQHWRSFRSDGPGPKVTLASLTPHAEPDLSLMEDLSYLPVSESAPPSIDVADDKHPLRFRPLFEFTSRAFPRWYIKGLLPEADLGMIYGPSGSGKSFFAYDLACTLARGAQEWGGRRVRSAKVGWIAAEAVGSVGPRALAYAKRYDIPVDTLDVPVIAASPDMGSRQDVEHIARGVKALGIELLFVDTLAAVSGNRDENKTEIQQVLNGCRAIRNATGAMVVVIHHAGKELSKGARGSSAIRATVDFELEVQNFEEPKSSNVRVTKMRDGRTGDVFGFKLLVETIGVDEDGEAVTSCAIALCDPAVKKANLRLGAVEAAVQDAARDLAPIAEGAGVEIGKLITEAAGRLAHDPEAGRDKRREHARRAIDSLVRKGVLRVENGLVVWVS